MLAVGTNEALLRPGRDAGGSRNLVSWKLQNRGGYKSVLTHWLGLDVGSMDPAVFTRVCNRFDCAISHYQVMQQNRSVTQMTCFACTVDNSQGEVKCSPSWP